MFFAESLFEERGGYAQPRSQRAEEVRSRLDKRPDYGSSLIQTCRGERGADGEGEYCQAQGRISSQGGKRTGPREGEQDDQPGGQFGGVFFDRVWFERTRCHEEIEQPDGQPETTPHGVHHGHEHVPSREAEQTGNELCQSAKEHDEGEEDRRAFAQPAVRSA